MIFWSLGTGPCQLEPVNATKESVESCGILLVSYEKPTNSESGRLNDQWSGLRSTQNLRRHRTPTTPGTPAVQPSVTTMAWCKSANHWTYETNWKHIKTYQNILQPKLPHFLRQVSDAMHRPAFVQQIVPPFPEKCVENIVRLVCICPSSLSVFVRFCLFLSVFVYMSLSVFVIGFIVFFCYLLLLQAKTYQDARNCSSVSSKSSSWPTAMPLKPPLCIDHAPCNVNGQIMSNNVKYKSNKTNSKWQDYQDIKELWLWWGGDVEKQTPSHP